jgi:hypothetical protein
MRRARCDALKLHVCCSGSIEKLFIEVMIIIAYAKRLYTTRARAK